MSRQVDIMAGPLSDQDRDYLEQRGRRHLILQNDRMFAGGDDADASLAPQGSTDDDVDDEMTWDEEVDQLTVDELKAELADRDLATSGNKPELQKRLKDAGPPED